MDEVELSPLMIDLAKHAKEEGEAAEDFRQALNSRHLAAGPHVCRLHSPHPEALQPEVH